MKAVQLIPIFPNSKIASFLPYWDEAVEFAGLKSPERIAMFLAQIGHECGGFTRFVENLNYDAQGLANTWPKRYAVDWTVKVKVPNELAISIQRKPIVIANKTYAFRFGNRDVGSGDGWKYRGRGTIMRTFYDNYLRADNVFDLKGELVENPDLLLEPRLSLLSGALYWNDHKLNAFADKKDITGARKAINGGTIGLDKVTILYYRIIKL